MIIFFLRKREVLEILVPYKPTRIFDLQRKNNEDYCTACGTYTNTKWRNENYNW